MDDEQRARPSVVSLLGEQEANLINSGRKCFLPLYNSGYDKTQARSKRTPEN